MTCPTSHVVPGIVWALRAAAGESQQVFATRLGLSTRTLHCYESGHHLPEPKQFVALMAEALDANRPDLYLGLQQALHDSLDIPPGYSIDLQRNS